VIGTTSHQVSRARSNTTSLLALFLTFSLMAHGLFFQQEWLIFGVSFSIFSLLSYSDRSFNFVTREEPFGLTDVLLLGMFCLSILGLANAVIFKDGLIEALRWGTFWLVYRMGVRISREEISKKRLVQYIEWLAIGVAIIGWLPWVSKVAGRLSSVFGYANATAAFLGAVLLLCSLRKPIQIFLGISLLGTGSRAGVGIFIVVFILQQLRLGVRGHRIPSSTILLQKVRATSLKKTIGKIIGIKSRKHGFILLGFAGTVLMLHYDRSVWENLTTWGFSSSSWQERLDYFKDGIRLALNARGLPVAGGWMAFPTVQRIPYWTADPHSSLIHILINQGVAGIVLVGIWSSFTLAQAWKTRAKESMSSRSPEGAGRTKAEVGVWGALLFLAVHSFVDADFSFGSLGVLFWLLWGSFQKRNLAPRPQYLKWYKFTHNLSSKGIFSLSLCLCLVSGNALLNPALLEKEKIWNTQARLEREQDPAQSIALWKMSLIWDQTQISTRREQAEFLLRRGDTEAGLKAVQEVLRWQPFNLEAYEWAQAGVWEVAEGQRSTHPEIANKLYRWVESVPENIEGRVAKLSLSDQLLWHGYREFQVSPHIKLLAEYARQRQLTQLPPRT